MAEKKKTDPGLIHVGRLLEHKRKALGDTYQSRESFINERSLELFDGTDWISIRHLTNLELGHNWPSILMLLQLATALEEDPVDLFSEIVNAYQSKR